MNYKRLFLLVAFVVMSLGALPVHANERDYRLERSEAFPYELVVDGNRLESVAVQKNNGLIFTIADVGKSIYLPAGTYCVESIMLQGSGVFNVIERRTQVTLIDNVTNRLDCDLIPTVKVTRDGSMATLDYMLYDKYGSTYGYTDKYCPPGFVVKKDGKEIGSGSFEYG